MPNAPDPSRRPAPRHLPAGGAHLLLTRPAEASARFAAAFRARHPEVPVVISPLLAIRPRPFALPGGIGGVILTSAHAPAALAPGAGCGLTAWCVGEATARAARAQGFAVRTAGGDAAALVALIARERPAGRLLHLSGEEIAADVAAGLAARGIAAERRIVYAQEPLAPDAGALALLGGTAPVLLALFSPRSAALAAGIRPVRAPLHVAAMSPAVARAWTGEAPAALRIAAEPGSAAMLGALDGLIAGLGAA